MAAAHPRTLAASRRPEEAGAGAAHASLPPCGGGIGRGVTRALSTTTTLINARRRKYVRVTCFYVEWGTTDGVERSAVTPLPIPPPQGGREPRASPLRVASAAAWAAPVVAHLRTLADSRRPEEAGAGAAHASLLPWAGGRGRGVTRA